MLRRVLLLILITLSFILSGCGNDAKSPVQNKAEVKSGVKISEVNNEKKDLIRTNLPVKILISQYLQIGPTLTTDMLMA